jgi:hypothetical protein
VSYAPFAITTFQNMLGTLDHLVGKAQDAGLSDDVLASKLAEDMFPLELQFRIAINQVLLALNQVGGQTAPLEKTAYGSLTEVRDRIAAVRARLDQVDPNDWAPANGTVDLTLPNGVRFVMTAEEDIRDWILPNFYFHVSMAYALLRHAGIEIGKLDFIPHMARHKASPAG